MATKNTNPGAAQRVRPVQGLRLYKTYLKNVTTSSQTFAELIGESLQSDVGCIEVNNQSGNTVSFQNGVAVAATDGSMVTGQAYAFFGRDTELDTIELIAGGTSAISIIQHVSI